MSAAAVLEEATKRGIVLSTCCGRLNYAAPIGALTPGLRRDLIQHRPALLAYLSIPSTLLQRFRQAIDGLHVGVIELAEYLSDDFEEVAALSDELLRLIACDLSNRRVLAIREGGAWISAPPTGSP